MTNYLYSAAPKDGTVIGTFSRSIPTIPLLTPPGTFDARKFTWLGSMSGDTSLCLTGGTSAVKTWQDMLTKPLIMGGQAVGADSDIYARLYKNVLGAKIRIVSGYPGTTEITLAMERGEVDGICGLSWGTVKVSHPEWRKNKSVNFLLQAGLNKDPDLPDVPFAMDLVKEPEKKQILYLHFAPQAMGRPFAAPPDIPADRKAALIRAFDNAMKDPELLAEAAKLRMDIDPMTGSQIDELLGADLCDASRRRCQGRTGGRGMSSQSEPVDLSRRLRKCRVIALTPVSAIYYASLRSLARDEPNFPPIVHGARSV